jgi:hypothetical protein
MEAALLKPDHALEAEFLVDVEPGVDGIGVSALQEAVLGNGMGRHAISDLQQGSAAFTDVGSWVVVTVMTKLVGLGVSQVEGPAISGHGCCLSSICR